MVKIARKRRGVSARVLLNRLGMAATVVGVMVLLVTSIQRIGSLIDNDLGDTVERRSPPLSEAAASTVATAVSHKTPLAYGTKDHKERTAELVEHAIASGFRHIVTGGHHIKHNETGVGIGWKASGVPRHELFLQTSFVPFAQKEEFKQQLSDPEPLPEAIEDQVKVSVQTSLENLKTDYIDAYLFHNFRAKMWDTEEIHKAWKVLETYVEEGVIHKLGLTSIHDAQWFETFYNNTKIKPTIVQNRFHSNRKYDVPMQETFAKHDIWVQRFWLLNGSSSMGKKNEEMATEKAVTPAQLMLAFAMSLGSQTCLVGTRSPKHMKDDLEIAKCYPSLFLSDQERLEYAQRLGMQLKDQQQLYGTEGVDFGNDQSPKCDAVPTGTRM
mmetsp:Transcript_7451/g.15433  ORF Transcript_7451/g.15433 Transcript_7451/m.15433 type:complete len:383 (+) Transcript_7451:297-1445(+)